MANFISEERAAVRFMIGVIGLEFAMAMIFGTGLPIAYYQHWQQDLVRQEMGQSALRTLLHLTGYLYTALFVHSGLQHWLMPPAPKSNTSAMTLTGKLAWLSRDRITTLLALFYIAIFRVLVFLSWSIALVPLIFAAAYDGWVQRQVAQFRFVYQSGQKHFIGNRGSKVMTYGLLLLFFLPIPIPPFAIFFWAILLGIFSHIWMKNMPKRI
ncbi:DUF4400 domain-containing protein [Acidithiobacillus caldus]|uniref:DUF4400 domain-containing protein n=1 Tax=Acidithiobacillus caldus TaxID=33059 RepID=A0A1E7YN33_9PROT|nr:DUF4400 domain-containing protein [Acidithiobacillus caldus]OFC35987.1 hypothetical protein BAE27_06755 [Acidithiobacillus caldus]OFC38349.1 hypothetical protein BAE28_05725 [Acidithiobacillus caldus]OFC40377.1 hypothetical protein BAE29_05340 [Acidithiobacillus caldus]